MNLDICLNILEINTFQWGNYHDRQTPSTMLMVAGEAFQNGCFNAAAHFGEKQLLKTTAQD